MGDSFSGMDQNWVNTCDEKEPMPIFAISEVRFLVTVGLFSAISMPSNRCDRVS